jgi:hypothetical protein
MPEGLHTSRAVMIDEATPDELTADRTRTSRIAELAHPAAIWSRTRIVKDAKEEHAPDTFERILTVNDPLLETLPTGVGRAVFLAVKTALLTLEDKPDGL